MSQACVDPASHDGEDRFRRGLKRLAGEGLDAVAFVDRELGPRAPEVASEPEHGLLMFLSLGRSFWERMPVRQGCEDPLDARATVLTSDFVRTHLPSSPRTRQVYPGTVPIDLRRWMAAGGVQFASRLGTGIRPDCGPWLAVRAAWWVRLSPTLRAILRAVYPPLDGASPCESCVEQPCLTACPAGALGGSPRLERCVDHRLQPQSTCASRCLARIACPVGEHARYGEAQMAYHYDVSLKMLRAWKSARGAP